MQIARVTAIAAGLVAAAITDGLLVAAGLGHFAGPPVGLLAAPMLLTVLSGRVRDSLRREDAASWVAVGAAWICAPFLDQHLTGAVVLDGVIPDLIHHTAGWAALLPAWRRLPIGERNERA